MGNQISKNAQIMNKTKNLKNCNWKKYENHFHLQIQVHIMDCNK